MSKLRFSVASCSSEDASFPASELEQHASSSQGYMTAKNCSYPQELVLQLHDGVCRLTQVQLLSHQTHIATKMELFVSSSHMLDDTTHFARLGFLTLKSNKESRYLARELKTVHIDQETALLKLRIHACHINEHNLYGQVGVMAINLCGEPFEGGLLPSHSSDEAVAVKPSKPKHSKPNGSEDLSFDMRFDAKTAAKIREIRVAKDQAVANEDYDQAKRLKQMEEQLKSVGLQLSRLETQKREAVANEDYDLAKKIKQEIGMLEASVGGNESQPILPIPAVALSPARSQVLPRGGAVQRSTSNFSPRDMYPEDQPQGGKNYGEGGHVLQQSNSGHSGFPGDNDDPAGGGADDANHDNGEDNAPNPHFRGIPDAENLTDPDEIPAALAKESEELIAVIGPFFTRCVYSNLWNHRDAATRKVTMEMDNYPVEPMRLLEVCSTLAQSGAGDRIAQVALSAFGLIDRMVSFGSRVRRDDMCRIIGNSMMQLVNKLGESQAKVRDEAAAVLGRLATAKNVGVAFVTSHLTKRAKKPLGLKLLQGRLLVLKRLLTEFELLPDTDFSVSGIMSFLEDCNCLAHQSREIRDAAKDITVSLYLIVGAEVEGYLKSLRPKQLEEYQSAFEAAETEAAAARRGGGGGGGVSANKNVARRVESPQKVQAQFNGEQEDDGDSEDEESVDEYTCPFCGVVDEKFDSDYLDQHFWASCKMLTPCKMCGQVIEISTLNEHLLTECEMQQNHRECPRCGEAITAKFFERHVSLNDCPPRAPPNRANRCPLCHDDISSGKRGWRRHLLEEGCPNNPRS
ncbi:hypothetical protein BBO99_00001698 [Phytophthora kernoviae]|uniref:TOG domain-containing protein n=1 Tax=Phytophthora kernoviae TaxID=325452 RepID=A0A421ESK1_9STRA|nr:hypothetical protein JM16_006426 [Phytophthora kernoviae]RLM96080.1 hypothetical protein BBI17_001723 [Phytophthora kernoviae]RLN83968.1 hypothetical protein BBO99_00001698 [Phytophthora kernoviae]